MEHLIAKEPVISLRPAEGHNIFEKRINIAFTFIRRTQTRLQVNANVSKRRLFNTLPDTSTGDSAETSALVNAASATLKSTFSFVHKQNPADHQTVHQWK